MRRGSDLNQLFLSVVALPAMTIFLGEGYPLGLLARFMNQEFLGLLFRPTPSSSYRQRPVPIPELDPGLRRGDEEEVFRDIQIRRLETYAVDLTASVFECVSLGVKILGPLPKLLANLVSSGNPHQFPAAIRHRAKLLFIHDCLNGFARIGVLRIG